MKLLINLGGINVNNRDENRCIQSFILQLINKQEGVCSSSSPDDDGLFFFNILVVSAGTGNFYQSRTQMIHLLLFFN